MRSATFCVSIISSAILATCGFAADHGGGHGESPAATNPPVAVPATETPAASEHAAPAAKATPSNGVALQRLMEGNKRYAAGKAEAPRRDAARRAQTATSQKPIAAVLCCADSRVPPEILFDQGMGDLFVVRVAGNIVDDAVLGSLEYAVEHLGVDLVVVLGHERCGAVKAASAGGEAPGHLPALLTPLRPAVEQVRGQPGDLVENAVKANARNMAKQLRDARPVLKAAGERGALAVVPARYDLDDGSVEVLW